MNLIGREELFQSVDFLKFLLLLLLESSLFQIDEILGDLELFEIRKLIFLDRLDIFWIDILRILFVNLFIETQVKSMWEALEIHDGFSIERHGKFFSSSFY